MLVMILRVFRGLPIVTGIRLEMLPQAPRRFLPALGIQFVRVAKRSSLASVIGPPELPRKANELVVTGFRPRALTAEPPRP